MHFSFTNHLWLYTTVECRYHTIGILLIKFIHFKKCFFLKNEFNFIKTAINIIDSKCKINNKKIKVGKNQ